jgi:hypothetical protein
LVKFRSLATARNHSKSFRSSRSKDASAIHITNRLVHADYPV